jgi:hypothetical protein
VVVVGGSFAAGSTRCEEGVALVARMSSGRLPVGRMVFEGMSDKRVLAVVELAAV